MKKYISMFLQSAPEAITTMKKQHAEKDWPHLKTTAHSLKPQLAYMGIESLKETILRIEEYAGEEKNPDVILQLIETVEANSVMAFDELHQAIESLNM
ncbi:MAG: Hpt domain-containing protein [Chitinophagales bacterium]